ncbi:MAG: hypothetical protein ACRDGM_12560 [bacterium]
MRIDFERAGKAGGKPLKAARYFPRQPHEDSVLVTVNEAYIRAAFEGSVADHVAHWHRRGFRPGHAPRSLLPEEAVNKIREFVCAQLASYVVEQIGPKLDPPPFLPPATVHGEWVGEGDFLVKLWYCVAPHTPDPMQMFDLEISLEDDPLKMAYGMSGNSPEGGNVVPPHLKSEFPQGTRYSLRSPLPVGERQLAVPAPIPNVGAELVSARPNVPGQEEIATSGFLERLGTGLAMTGAQAAGHGPALSLPNGSPPESVNPAPAQTGTMAADPLSGPTIPPAR